MPTVLVLLFSLLAPVLGAVDTSQRDAAYRAWSQGRPEEALPILLAQAEASATWHDWLDAGLAAADAGDQGLAVGALLEAHLLAPGRAEPQEALAALGIEAPVSWTWRLGPIAAIGQGWSGALLALLAGLAGGLALAHRPGLWRALIGGGVLLLILPGQVAQWHDGARHYVAACTDSYLLDSSGQPLVAVDAGSILRLLAPTPLAGRYRVALADGRKGTIPVGDCTIRQSPRTATGVP